MGILVSRAQKKDYHFKVAQTSRPKKKVLKKQRKL
jgi:hypothetical protein